MALTGSEVGAARDETGEAGKLVRVDPTRSIAFAMIVVSVLWRAQIASRGYLAADDYVLITQSTESPLTPGFLLTLYNNHFMPGGRLLTWLVTDAVGLTYWPYVLLMAAGQAVLSIAFYRLLRDLLRPSRLLLVPLGMFLFSPLTLEATSWWAVGANMLPMQLSMVLAVGAQLRYVRTRRKRHLLSLVLAVLLGLLFFEKALLVVPLVFLFTVCFFTDGGPVRSVLTALRRWWPSWLVLTALVGAFAAVYLQRSESSVRRPESAEEVLSFFTQLFGSTLVPGLLGGPWGWLGAGDGAAVVAPPELGRWIAWSVFAALVVLTVKRDRTATRAWILLGSYLVLVAALLAATRLGSVFSGIAGGVPRYVSDAVVVAAICVGVALVGIARPTPAGGEPADNESALPTGSPAPSGESEPTAAPSAVASTQRSGAAPAASRPVVAARSTRAGVIHAEAPDDPDPGQADEPVTDPDPALDPEPAAEAQPATAPAPPAQPEPEATALPPGDGRERRPSRPAPPEWLGPVPERYREVVTAGLALLLVAAMFGTAWTTSRYSDEWAKKYGRSYLDTARIELASAPPGTVFFDTPVPEGVVSDLSWPYNLQSRFFAAAGSRPEFVHETENASVLDGLGRVQVATIQGSNIVPGPQAGCGYLVPAGQTVRMPLDKPRDEWFWIIRIGYLSSADGTAVLRLGAGSHSFPVKKGLNQRFFEIDGGGDAVELTVTGTDLTLCTNEITIGNLAPKPE
ncbi:hypothetical protein [Micromonospora sp. BL4]|uniref:hypothetical protein n=1 Tax=Micromonospora sp. BL4 TaxID=2478710 RepID=UPI0011C44412|nr:hypothetical protein [Micromonospora sp. BL4]